MNPSASVHPYILAVDDQPNNLVAMKRLLKGVEAHVLTAASGQEALSLALDHDLALVLLDVHMPGMDGYEVAELLHSAEKTENLPIIFLTAAYRDDSHRLKGYRAGAVDYLEKPLDEVVLLSKVNVFLDLHRSRRALHDMVSRVSSLNSDLRDANLRLHQKVQDLESFSYTISHDLRAPLRAINGFASILEAEHAPNLDQDAKGLLQSIRNNSVRMGRLIDDLLTFFRTASDEVQTRDVDTRTLAEEVVAECCNDDRYPRTEIVIGELPPVQADPAMLKVALHNLVKNALKYSSEAAAPQVELSGEPRGEEVELYVRDNGVGFDMAYADKLFGVFERLESNAGDFEGTGVGLAIVDRIVARHGGRVWAEGAPGEGATFYLRLPRGEGRPGDRRGESSIPSSQPSP